MAAGGAWSHSADMDVGKAVGLWVACCPLSPPFQLPPPPCLPTLPCLRMQVENKERHADDIRKDVELASLEADKTLSDQV